MSLRARDLAIVEKLVGVPHPNDVAARRGLLIPAGFTDNQRQWMIKLDAEAVRLGNEIKDSHPHPSAMRVQAQEDRTRGLVWLSDRCFELADQIERDPRLAAISTMSAAATRDGGLRRFFIGQYRTLLLMHLESK